MHAWASTSMFVCSASCCSFCSWIGPPVAKIGRRCQHCPRRDYRQCHIRVPSKSFAGTRPPGVCRAPFTFCAFYWSSSLSRLIIASHLCYLRLLQMVMRICKDLLLDGFDSPRALSYVEKTDAVIEKLAPTVGEVRVSAPFGTFKRPCIIG